MVELPEEKNFIREVGMPDLIKGCIAIEKTAASIYGTFMQLFPKEKNFWKDLFNDEIDHAEKILLSERLHVDKIKDMMIKKGFLKLS